MTDKLEKCAECDGKGSKHVCSWACADIKCEKCGGTGAVRMQSADTFTKEDMIGAVLAGIGILGKPHPRNEAHANAILDAFLAQRGK